MGPDEGHVKLGQCSFLFHTGLAWCYELWLEFLASLAVTLSWLMSPLLMLSAGLLLFIAAAAFKSPSPSS